MITLGIIDARVKRQKIAEQANGLFIPRREVRQKIGVLRERDDQQFLFGIFESDDRWTALSVNRIISCYDGVLSELNLQTEAEIFHDFFGQDNGKQKSDVVLLDGRRFWMKSVGISCSFQNIILMLQRLPEDVILEE